MVPKDRESSASTYVSWRANEVVSRYMSWRTNFNGHLEETVKLYSAPFSIGPMAVRIDVRVSY